MVSLDDLVSRKAKRQSCPLCMVLDDSLHRMVCPVDGTAVIIRGAEVLHLWLFLVVCDMDRMADQLVYALVLGSGNRHHRNAEHLFHAIDVDGALVLPELIHHV